MRFLFTSTPLDGHVRPLLPLAELALGLAAVVRGLDRPVVLGTETILQVRGAPPAVDDPRDQRNRRQHNDGEHDPENCFHL